MFDIAYDIIQREIMMTGEGATADFLTTTNPSVQNGGIMLFSRCAVRSNPMIGIGLGSQVMNGHPAVAVKELNRWKAACSSDGATLAKWNASANANGNLVLDNIEVSYL